MKEIIQSEIYFEKVQNPKIGEIYFYFDKGKGFPVIVLDGDWERNGRLSNSWSWRNLLTGQKENGYGNFYELKSREDLESEN